MLTFASDFSPASLNEQSKIIEVRYYNDIMYKVPDTMSVAIAYMQQIPNVAAETKSPPMSARMARFKKAGLIGCFNNTGVNSSNYKEIISESYNGRSSDS